MTNWYILDGTLTKDPTPEKLAEYEKHLIIELVPSVGEGIVTEVWWVDIDKNTCINFSYATIYTDLGHVEFINWTRRDHMKQHNVDPAFDRMYFLPKSWFGEDTVRLPYNM